MEGDDLSNSPLLPQSESRLPGSLIAMAEEGISPAQPADVAVEEQTRGAAERAENAPKPKGKPKRK